MSWGRMGWVAGGYLVGTFPSTWIVARYRGATGVIAASRRGSGEADAHIVMRAQIGAGWSAVAATSDVLKALLFVLAAREWGHLEPRWLAAVGVAVVAGHSFPFYARQMAGRGLAAAAGVLLVLLPVEMVVTGVLIVVGNATRVTGIATTIGLASVPVVAAVQGQPGPLVAMAVAIVVLIAVRRLEGLHEVTATGISLRRALLYRVVFDASEPPPELRRRHPQVEHPDTRTLDPPP